ncbi:MAG: 1-deoxy-D-xylulose-5-phosphate synthase [Paludibacteraceae bacterium]|nr:1-deoxy-D-xylulose-5-phosphate synthase [Paludibacteraceae bacterium]
MADAAKKYTLLNRINCAADLRSLPEEQLTEVCDELRTYILETLSEHPGHLASSLGTVELTVALHYVFDTPYDRIVWDVGHQAYSHKILTGRRERFQTLREYKGLSPFPSPLESEADSFIAGHASNSISAALGMSVSAREEERRNPNIKSRKVVAVIGDGAMSGGLAFEGLNNVSTTSNDLLIVLNDNHMAIDAPKGGMSQYLLDITTSRTYNNLRNRLYQFFRRHGLMNESRKKCIQRATNHIKTILSKQHSTIFEFLSIRYFGPVDGNDLPTLIRLFTAVRDFRGPKVVHLITKKGKGYAPAEENAAEWHAPGRFDVKTGVRCRDGQEGLPSRYQDVFGETLLELAKQNPDIYGITAAMPTGCSLSIMMKEMPQRCFDVGIAEGHAVTFAAGLAKEGKLPFCAIYSTFLQRAYDNIVHDVAICGLPVVFCIDRAGLVGADGATHHGLFDMAYLRSIPNMTVAAPSDEKELRNLMYTAQRLRRGPFAIRYPRGRGIYGGEAWRNPFEETEVGRGRILKQGKDLAVISVGTMAQTVLKAVENVEQETAGKTVAVYDLRFVKPLDEAMLEEIGGRHSRIVTVEDGVRSGGAGSAVLEWLSEHGYSGRVTILGLPDRFVAQGRPEELYAEVGLDVAGVSRRIKEELIES